MEAREKWRPEGSGVHEDSLGCFPSLCNNIMDKKGKRGGIVEAREKWRPEGSGEHEDAQEG